MTIKIMFQAFPVSQLKESSDCECHKTQMFFNSMHTELTTI